jgi:Tfp pilus assembly protein PilN
VAASKTLWLTTFDNTGNRLNMAGLATSVNAVADFIGNLKRTGYFNNVEIREIIQGSVMAGVTTFGFSLGVELQVPGQAQAQAGTAKPKT